MSDSGSIEPVAVDTSAVIAVLKGERDRDRIVEQLRAAESRLISAATAVELGIVVESLPDGRTPLERVLADFDLTVVPVDESQLRIAMEGWRRFGKGRNPAGLNYGDCFSYALARSREIPLVYVGDDFTKAGFTTS